MVDEMLKLDEDEKEVVLKTVKDIQFAVQQLNNWIKEDKLTNKMKETVVGLLDINVSSLGKILKEDTESTEKLEERYCKIRNANLKIRELEEKLGSKNSIVGLEEQLKSLSKLVKSWWDRDGFDYVREMGFTQQGHFQAELGISFHHHSYIYSDTPASDRYTRQAWIQYLKDTGYLLYEKENSSDIELIDCPENRTLIEDMIEARFPSALIREWKSNRNYDAPGRVYSIQSIHIDIDDLSEIQRLESYLKKGEL